VEKGLVLLFLPKHKINPGFIIFKKFKLFKLFLLDYPHPFIILTVTKG